MADFPASIFTPRTTANQSGVVYDPTKTKEVFAEDYSLPAAEIAEIETILGTNPQGAYATVKAWLTALAAVCANYISSASRDPGHVHSKLVASDGSPDPALSVGASGNVGIGTASPGQLLTVTGSGNLGTANIGLYDNYTGGSTSRNWLIGNGYGATTYGELGFFVSATQGGTPATTPAMDILSSGNVGIGTTTPTSKLHVVGLPVYANNAAAVVGGLTAGAFYRTGADPDSVCVVH